MVFFFSLVRFGIADVSRVITSLEQIRRRKASFFFKISILIFTFLIDVDLRDCLTKVKQFRELIVLTKVIRSRYLFLYAKR